VEGDDILVVLQNIGQKKMKFKFWKLFLLRDDEVQFWPETWVLICDTGPAHEAFSVHELQAKYQVTFGIAFYLDVPGLS
jgi:hypothetical protein